MRLLKRQFANIVAVVISICTVVYLSSINAPSDFIITLLIKPKNPAIISEIKASSSSVFSTNTVDAISAPRIVDRSLSNSPATSEHQKISYAILQSYFGKLPALYVRREGNDLLYTNSIDSEKANLAYFKDLAERGNSKAKLIYANILSAPLLKRFYEELSAGNLTNSEQWQSDFSEIQKLLIESASEGEYLAAVQLTMVPPLQSLSDKEELLTWSLLADRMDNSGGQSSGRTCALMGDACNIDALIRSSERAKMYIDLYKFKTL